jgi:hypothetical protein
LSGIAVVFVVFVAQRIDTLATMGIVWIVSAMISVVPGILIRRIWPNHFRDYDLKNQASRYFGLRSRIAGAVVLLISAGLLWVVVANWSDFDDWKVIAGGIFGLVLGGYYLVTGKRAATPGQFILEGKLSIDDPGGSQSLQPSDVTTSAPNKRFHTDARNGSARG